jgi:WD40 repeat protein
MVLLVMIVVAGCGAREPTEPPTATVALPTATDAPKAPARTSTTEGDADLPEATPPITPPPTVTPTAIPRSTAAPPLHDGDGGTVVLAPENLRALERLYTLSGYATAFHPQEPVIATGELTGKIILWSLEDGSRLRELTDQHAMVFDLDFSPNENLLAAAFGAEAAVVDTTSGESLASFSGLGQFIQSVAFSPDGALLALGGWDGISVVGTTDWAEITELDGHQGGIFDLDFAPDGKVLVSAGGIPDSRVIVWNVENLQIEHTLEEHGGDVHSLAISPDGRFVVSGGVDRRVFLWDLSTGEVLQRLSGYGDVIYGLAHSPTGTLVAAACGGDGYVMFWDVEGTQAPSRLVDRGVEVLRVSFSPNGGLLAESNNQHEVVIWGFSQD